MNEKTTFQINKRAVKLIQKLIDYGYIDETSVKNLPLEKALEIPGMTMPDLRLLLELQHAISKGPGVYSLLVSEKKSEGE